MRCVLTEIGVLFPRRAALSPRPSARQRCSAWLASDADSMSSFLRRSRCTSAVRVVRVEDLSPRTEWRIHPQARIQVKDDYLHNLPLSIRYMATYA